MTKILFDTDVLIEVLRGNEEITAHVENLFRQHARLAYTPVTEAEIFRGVRSNEKNKVETTLSSLECLDINKAAGRRAGEYLRSYSKSHGVQVADALVAAAAFFYKFSLCTLNWKHYPMSDIDKHRI